MRTSAVWVLGAIVGMTPAWAGGTDMRSDFAKRDAWVKEHFQELLPPHEQSGVRLMSGVKTLRNYGPVQRDRRDGMPLQIAGKTFKKGLYCHAVSRIAVRAGESVKRFTAVVGGETNGDYSGGSMVFTVSANGKELYRSPKLLRGQPGLPIAVDLGGAHDFEIGVEDAGDGINSDQACWGDAKLITGEGKETWLSDLRDADQRKGDRLPFTLNIGNRPSDELLCVWDFTQSVRTVGKERTETTNTYRDRGTGLEVRFVGVVYKDFPVVEWTVFLKNTGAKDSPVLSDVRALDANLKFEKEILLHHFVGSPCAPNDYQPLETTFKPNEAQRIATAGGRPTNTALPYFNLETDKSRGVIAAIGWPGQWSSEFQRNGDELRVRAGQEFTYFTLRPGEEVRSPLAVLLFYRGDWIDGQNVWRRWMIADNIPKDGQKPLKPMSAVCMGNSYPGIITNAAQELVYLKRYVEEGIKPNFWWEDAGWYKCGDPPAWTNTGTWEVEPARWPKGIREVSDWCRSQAIRTMVWFEPERVAAGFWLAENKPQWVLGGKNGGLLNLGMPECRRWIIEKIDSVMKEQGIDLYRQDFNIDPLGYWQSNDGPDRQGITEIKHIEGYLAFWDELKHRNHNMLIDSCASGGRRNDLETLRRAVPLLRSDYIFEPVGEQNHTYGISFWMPYNGTGFLTQDMYLIRSAMAPWRTIGVDLTPKGLDCSILKKAMADWRRVSPAYFGDYYPLTPFSLANDVWMAWQFNLPEKGSGFFQAFRRADCATESLVIQLRGLDPKATYNVTDLDGGKPVKRTGKQLMDGFNVRSAAKASAMLFAYRRAGKE